MSPSERTDAIGSERLSAERLRTFTAAVFRRLEVPEEDATRAAEVLTAADLWGISTHGVARLPAYVAMITGGHVNPRPEIQVVGETASTATIDGDGGLGLVVAWRAVHVAVRKAREAGTGWAAVRGSNHFGAARFFAMQGLRHDMVGIAMTNTPAQVAPLWGRKRMLGTNPIALAAPADEEPPLVMDFATSAIAYGRVEHAARAGVPLPDRVAIDRHGRVTTRAEDMLDGGALLPLGSDREHGGHKGYCLAAFVDVLCGVLTGANWGPFVPPFPVDLPDPGRRVGEGTGHLFGFFRTDAFLPAGAFRARIDAWRRALRATPPAEGASHPIIPGDPEHEAEAERTAHGIALSEDTSTALRRLGAEVGVPFPASS